MKRVIVVSMEDTMCKQIDHIQTQLDNINIEELIMKEITKKYPDDDYPKTIGELNNFWNSFIKCI